MGERRLHEAPLISFSPMELESGGLSNESRRGHNLPSSLDESLHTRHVPDDEIHDSGGSGAVVGVDKSLAEVQFLLPLFVPKHACTYTHTFSLSPVGLYCHRKKDMCKCVES